MGWTEIILLNMLSSSQRYLSDVCMYTESMCSDSYKISKRRLQKTKLDIVYIRTDGGLKFTTVMRNSVVEIEISVVDLLQPQNGERGSSTTENSRRQWKLSILLQPSSCIRPVHFLLSTFHVRYFTIFLHVISAFSHALEITVCVKKY